MRILSSRLVAAVFCAVFVLSAASGCGPIEYVNQVTRKASTEVEKARVMGAQDHSPYWFTRAVEYLSAARAEAAHADYQAATRFGRLSEESALKAQEETEQKLGPEGVSNAPEAADSDAPIDSEMPPGLEDDL